MNQTINQEHKQSYYPVEPKPPVKKTEGLSEHQPLSGMSTNNWLLFLHLSQFANAVIPLGGIIAPILIWQIKKDDHPSFDLHGKMVCNWVLTQIIYTIVCALLTFVLIGIPLLMILGVCSIAFPVIGAIKANEGKLWRYPGSIEFIK